MLDWASLELRLNLKHPMSIWSSLPLGTVKIENRTQPTKSTTTFRITRIWEGEKSCFFPIIQRIEETMGFLTINEVAGFKYIVNIHPHPRRKVIQFDDCAYFSFTGWEFQPPTNVKTIQWNVTFDMLGGRSHPMQRTRFSGASGRPEWKICRGHERPETRVAGCIGDEILRSTQWCWDCHNKPWN